MQKACGHPTRGSRSLRAHGFRVSFTPFERVLFTFPSRYSCTIGRRLVFSLVGWAPRIRTGFHVSRPTWDAARPGPGSAQGAVTRCGHAFQRVALARDPAKRPSRNPAGHARRFGLVRLRSPLLAESLLISSPRGTEMFHFPRSRLPPPMDSGGDGALTRAGLLHSETHGSGAACASPWTIAACRVLRRLPSPRHPPCARTACPP